MKLIKIGQILLIACVVIGLSSCTTNRSRGYGSSYGSGMGYQNGAQATGVGESDSFADDSAGGRKMSHSRNTYYFDYDSNVIHEADKPAILANANYLVAHPRKKIILEGHTDPRGSREYNVALGERRANAVAELLRSRGVNPNQIRVVSYGAERLAAEGRTESDYQLDRRAIIVIQG